MKHKAFNVRPWLVASVLAFIAGPAPSQEPRDWLGLQIPRVCIEAVLEREDGSLLAIGYDIGAGSWYRFGDGRLTAFEQGRGVLTGAPVTGGGLVPAPAGTPPSDRFIEEMVLPIVYLSQVRANPAVVRAADRRADGVIVLTVVAPAGNPALAPGSAPDETVVVEVAPDLSVLRIDRPGLVGRNTPLLVLAREQGVPIQMIDYDARGNVPPTMPTKWRVVSASIKPAGSTARPCFTPESAEVTVLPIRRTADERALERHLRLTQAQASPGAPPPAPGTAPIGGPVDRTPGSLWGPALVVTGAVVLVVGGFVWLRSRR